jgi:hypothetical protein
MLRTILVLSLGVACFGSVPAQAKPDENAVILARCREPGEHAEATGSWTRSWGRRNRV